MINQVKAFVSVLFYFLVISSQAQDILYQKDGGEKRIVFDKKISSIIRYRDYDDPDFNLIEEKIRPYKKIKFANGSTVWLSMRDNYFRFRIGMDLGVSSPISDFGNNDASNSNAGYAGQAAHGSFHLDVGIYKFIGIKSMLFANASVDEPNNLSWSNFGFAIGPQFNIKLSSRFFASIPIMYQTTKFFSDYSETYNYTSGDGNGPGFVTGLGLHTRIGQHFSIGYKFNYYQQKVNMTYFMDEYIDPFTGYITTEYQNEYSWAYMNNVLSFSIHF